MLQLLRITHNLKEIQIRNSLPEDPYTQGKEPNHGFWAPEEEATESPG